ncbi:MAG: AbrB/MazE/SpoVT family DNA-binding domain-containing protein [Oribacterium sp.]|nr:AbrB/MazE/SpoVT family DNA-binding domain-containing protein [Oribacterium sp.]
MSMITEVTSVSSKGQVVLPKTIRDALSLDTGSKLIVVTDGDNILLKPIVTPDISEFDALMKESQKWAKSVGMTEEDIDDAIKAVRKRRKA